MPIQYLQFALYKCILNRKAYILIRKEMTFNFIIHVSIRKGNSHKAKREIITKLERDKIFTQLPIIPQKKCFANSTLTGFQN